MFLALTFLPYSIAKPGFRVDGAYNTWSGLIWCRTEEACIHEIGHKLDDMAGWPSSSAEYKEAVGPTVWNEKETYAEIFRFYRGKEENMPAHLAKFYNWELADKLMEKYNG